MNRREALKALSATLGYTIASSTMVGLLSSCRHSSKKEKAEFFNNDEIHLINHLVDMILPPSSTPGGVELNLIQFIDKATKHTVKKAQQRSIRQGCNLLMKQFELHYNKPVLKGNQEEFRLLFKQYFDVSIREEKKVFSLLKTPFNKVKTAEKERYRSYQFLTFIRSLSLLGYFTSKEVQENVMNHHYYGDQTTACSFL